MARVKKAWIEKGMINIGREIDFNIGMSSSSMRD
jgi:hypothetical protein